MGRNKLSPSGRITIQFGKTQKAIDFFKEGKRDACYMHLISIRSQVLRDLCTFSLYIINDYNLLIKSPKEIAKITGFGERKVYDLIKTMRFIGTAEDEGFNNIQNKIYKLSDGDKQ